tara:strand:+ start:138 stop:248 length:111 start_codon:yes stop_codon:yes gene_type:complete
MAIPCLYSKLKEWLKQNAKIINKNLLTFLKVCLFIG